MNKKTLLLDIDYTLFDGTTPRPHLKEFLERVMEQFDVYFYTAASHSRVTEVCRILLHQMGMNPEAIRELNRYSLSRNNCQMINYHREDGGVIEIKCLDKAAEKLGVKREDIILLDDNPTYGHPHASQIIQAEGFMEYMVERGDDYLLRLQINPDDIIPAPPTIVGTPDAILEDGTCVDFKIRKSPYNRPRMSMFTGTPIVRTVPKVNRNEPCSCGSGKKYKKCCMQ